MAKLSTILDQIDAGSMLLPEFQRGYVWNRDQVRGLMRSLYRGYPVGALLVWETEGSDAGGPRRRAGRRPGRSSSCSTASSGSPRCTASSAARPPSFFEGDAGAFSGLRFNVETEAFQFYAPVEDEGRPALDRRHRAVRRRARVARTGRCSTAPRPRERFADYVGPALPAAQHPASATSTSRRSPARTRPSTSSSTSSTGSTPAAPSSPRATSRWPGSAPSGATPARRCAATWTAGASAGYQFTPDWLLRNVNAVATGRAPFSALEDVSADELPGRAQRVAAPHRPLPATSLAGRLGLDHDRVLMGRYAIPVHHPVLCTTAAAGSPTAPRPTRRCTGTSTPRCGAASPARPRPYLAKDLETVDKDGIDGVIASLAAHPQGQPDHRRRRTSRASAAAPAPTRCSTCSPGCWTHATSPPARPLGRGRQRPSRSMRSSRSRSSPGTATAAVRGQRHRELRLHHPVVGARPAVARPRTTTSPSAQPEVLASQWIPQTRSCGRSRATASSSLPAASCWRRRRTTLLDRLHAGTLPWDGGSSRSVSVTETGDDRTPRALADRCAGRRAHRDGVSLTPALDVEIPDPDTGIALAVAEAFWADGLQPGSGQAGGAGARPRGGRPPAAGRAGLRGLHLGRRAARLRRTLECVGTAPRQYPAAWSPTRSSTPDADASGDFHTARAERDRALQGELRYNPRYFRVMVPSTAPSARSGSCWQLPRSATASSRCGSGSGSTSPSRRSFSTTVSPHLFTDDERDIARKRLVDFGYAPTPA